MRQLPLYLTPERQATQIRLVMKHGGQCLQGHPTCTELAHYATVEWYAYLVPAVYEAVGDHVLPADGDLQMAPDGRPVPWHNKRGKRLSVTVRRSQVLRTWEDKAERAQHEAKEGWKAEDRARRSLEHIQEQRRLHDPLVGLKPRGVDRVIYHKDGSVRKVTYRRDPLAHEYEKRPGYHYLGLVAHPTKHYLCAEVVVAGTPIKLLVDVSGAVQPLGRNARKKVVRRGRDFPAGVEAKVQGLCRKAVREWWGSRKR